jgi:putative SOS response-associated peptidase YedK
MGLAAALRPWPSEYIETHDVSNFVNSPENDSPECIRPLPPGYVRRGQLPLV